MLSTGDGMALATGFLAVGGTLITTIIKMAPRLNGKYVPTAVCNERHDADRKQLARIEVSLDAIHVRLDKTQGTKRS